jgi:hypothetical protein
MYLQRGYRYRAIVMTKLPPGFDIPPGSEFPDLGKAKLNLGLENLVKRLLDDDQEIYQLAQDKKVELHKQREIDLKSFWESQVGAIERGNQNACDTKNLLDRVRSNQADKVEPIVLPSPAIRLPYGKGKNQTKLPKTRSSGPSIGNRTRPPSIATLPVNQLLEPAVSTATHRIDTIDPNNYRDKASRNMRQFGRAQAGQRGTSVGDRAVVFTANGTPMYGDSYLDKNNAENFAANQATSNQPLSQIPKDIKANKPMSAAGLQQQPRANVAPKGDTTSNLLMLTGIAVAITTVLFLFQHILIFVELILQVSSVTSTITNIAGSFVAILNNMGSLFGLGEGLIDPISKTFDSMLNNTMGQDKVDYMKYQFAKISSGFVAGQNILNKVTGLNNTVGKVTEDNANNTSKIGNAMKAMGMFNTNVPWMNEDNKVQVGAGKAGGAIGKVNQALDKISGLSNSLAEISSDVKTQVDEQKNLDKQYQERAKSDKDGVSKATEIHADEHIADLETLLGGKAQ